VASFVRYEPLSTIGNAIFNFPQTMGAENFSLIGDIRLSVSDPFTYTQSLTNGVNYYVYTQSPSFIRSWTTDQIASLDAIALGFSQIANLKFSKITNYAGSNPSQINKSSDINISFIHRWDLGMIAGVSGLNSDYGSIAFNYLGASGDIVLNAWVLGDKSGGVNLSLEPQSASGFTLLHEMGHSLGMSHPHISELPNGNRVLSGNFNQINLLGFQNLGFKINNTNFLDKSYFTIMSYDQAFTNTGRAVFPQNPMILDVIALQEAYGFGGGTSGSGNDVITPGVMGDVNSFRTYYDIGGVDTVNISNYSSGAYLHMGSSILGAPYAVGVSMSADDFKRIDLGKDPESIRWYYGDYENAIGGVSGDRIIGNSLNNMITGLGGDDIIDGGGGFDTSRYINKASDYVVAHSSLGWIVTSKAEGVDSISNIERLSFLDKSLALDLNGNAGVVAKVLGAVFGGAAVTNKIYVGIGLDLLDSGVNNFNTLGELALSAANLVSPEQVVTRLWTNVVGFFPSELDTAPYIKMLNDGMSFGELVHLAAESSSNHLNIKLMGLMESGIEFTPV
jgi:hypothetical protein